MTSERERAWPIATAALVAVAVACELVPPLANALRFERERLLTGEFWRFLSGHCVHGSHGLAALDLLVIAVLGTWWESRSRAAFVAIALASASLASTGVLVLTDLDVYVGSSAIGSGLFTAAALEIALERAGVRSVVGLIALALFGLKCALEARGVSVVAALPSGTRVCLEAHLLGGLGGLWIASARALRARRR